MFYGSMHFFIHSYPGTVLGFLFVTGSAKKLYKILSVLIVVFSEMLAVSLITFTIRQSEEQKELVGDSYKFFLFYGEYTGQINYLTDSS
ncbi:hypothetical protein COI95_22850 [Bacillus cereus]|nr:hypothetical protein COI95_22850 [Bacillus cereus]PFJ83879.1 hypothetical protein COI97_29615 [Bacillus cereus]